MGSFPQLRNPLIQKSLDPKCTTPAVARLAGQERAARGNDCRGEADEGRNGRAGASEVYTQKDDDQARQDALAETPGSRSHTASKSDTYLAWLHAYVTAGYH